MNEVPEIEIDISTQYLPQESVPEQKRYVFAYTITIINLGPDAVKLLNRHWLITDANEEVQEVRGEGVVGQQPRIDVGKHFQYTSGAVLETPYGTMEGSYQLVTDEGDLFEAPIPPFVLADPDKLH